MTDFYKIVKNGFVVGFGVNGSDDANAISEAEYDSLAEMFQDRPSAPEGYAYMIQDNPREWVLVELPPEMDEEIDDSEALEILLGETNI